MRRRELAGERRAVPAATAGDRLRRKPSPRHAFLRTFLSDGAARVPRDVIANGIRRVVWVCCLALEDADCGPTGARRRARSWNVGRGGVLCAATRRAASRLDPLIFRRYETTTHCVVCIVMYKRLRKSFRTQTNFRNFQKVRLVCCTRDDNVQMGFLSMLYYCMTTASCHEPDAVNNTETDVLKKKKKEKTVNLPALYTHVCVSS